MSKPPTPHRPWVHLAAVLVSSVLAGGFAGFVFNADHERAASWSTSTPADVSGEGGAPRPATRP